MTQISFLLKYGKYTKKYLKTEKLNIATVYIIIYACRGFGTLWIFVLVYIVLLQYFLSYPIDSFE